MSNQPTNPNPTNPQPTDKKPMNKTELVKELADLTGLDKQQVASVLDQLPNIVQRELSEAGPGEFAMHGLFKISKVTKKATEAKEKKNNFTGQMMTTKPKPEHTVVKIRALKGLKDMV